MEKLLIYLRFTGKEFLYPVNYVLAFLVGSIISFSQKNALFISPIPFIVPLFVQALSKSAVKFKNRRKDRLLLLPEKRKDPAFLMDKYGYILESTGKTFKLFNQNYIRTIFDFFGNTEECSLDELNRNGCFSPVTKKWYSIEISQPDESGNLLVWFTDITERIIHDNNLKSIREFNSKIIDSLDDLVVSNDIYKRLAGLIFNYDYTAIVILEVKNKFLEGYKFKRTSDGLLISEPIRLNTDSMAPVLLSRRVSNIISGTTSEYHSQEEFEAAYPFDTGVMEFIGEDIKNFINYHSGNVSIIAFNKKTEITNQDHLSMEAFVNTAMVTHSLVELAIKNDKKFMQSIDGLCASAEFSDEMTGKHLERVNKFSKLIAELYGMDDKFCTAIEQVASVHDIGKVAMPHIIKLERKLSDEERLELNMHPIYGAQIITKMMGKNNREYKYDMAYKITLNHHQMWNGTGYPALLNTEGEQTELNSRHFTDYLSYRPLSGNEIPLEALIVSLADKYDALRSSRHYKPSFSHSRTISILQLDDRTGVRGEDVFGERIMELFMDTHGKFADIYQSMAD